MGVEPAGTTPPVLVADNTGTKPVGSPKAPPKSPGASGHNTLPGAVVTETTRTAQAAIAHLASDAPDTAFKAVSAYQAERDLPKTSGEEHKQLLAHLKQFAVAATTLDRQLQTMNTKACLHEETAAKAERAAALNRKGASVDELISAEARVTRAVFAHHQSKEALAKAQILSHVDTVDLIGDYLAPDRN